MANRWCCGISLIILAMGILGCSSTKLTNTWTDKSFQSPGYHKILVVAFADSPTNRRSVEEEFALQLKTRRNKEAMSSAMLLPIESDLERSKIAKVSKENGFDAVMAIRLLGIDKQTKYVPGTVYVPTSSAYLGLTQSIHTPSELIQYDVVILETNLYDVNSERLVWGGTTETFSPSSVSMLIDELAVTVLEGMDKDKVL